MKPYKKDSISSLSDLFEAWMGGTPEQDDEIRTFLKQNELESIIGVNDVDVILRGDAYFPDILLPTVYAVLPVTLPVKDKELFIPLQELNKLNYKAAQNDAQTHCLSISFRNALDLQDKYSTTKKNKVTEYLNNLKEKELAEKKRLQDIQKALKLEEKQKRKLEEQKLKERQKEEAAQRRQQEKLEEQRRKLWLKKNTAQQILIQKLKDKRLILQNQQSELQNSPSILNESKTKIISNKISQLDAKIELYEQELKRELGRQRNVLYRERHRADLRQRYKIRRTEAKENNPEALRIKDKEYNQKADRKKYCRTYYEKHKDEISLKAQNNPKTKLYKQKYKAKQRFQKTTGVQILGLLQGIINKKTAEQ